MRSVEWRGNVVHCIRGGQYFQWNGVETWFVLSAEGNALGGMAWKRGSFYPRRAMVRCIRAGQCGRWNGVKMWFVVSAEGNAFTGVAWKRNLLYPRSVAFAGHKHTVKWHRNVMTCIRVWQSVRWNGVETWFPVSAKRCLPTANA